ncbi:nucleotidyltransferase family protein [Actinocatenispora rupis]|uniref:nucleotidyltransferase family protein n=1 Tax=Actinocatenispora rupis TaxID=519421 RepID=UPI001EF181D5|nr:nucleotidyltransferase family protein [Actinocatenispora rupis]
MVNPARRDLRTQYDGFLAMVRRNPVSAAILDRGPDLGAPDWWLTAGAVFQTVWNCLADRDPTAGIRDYDVFYHDPTDLSYEAEDAVVRRADALFADLVAEHGVTVEVRNEARVHLWYEQKFGVPCPEFADSADAIDHFAATTCCFGVTTDPDRTTRVYAPHGFGDLFARVVRPNPVLAPRSVYETKAARWQQEWPALTVLPWPCP